MTFQEALAQLRAGKKVRLDEFVFDLEDDAIVLADSEDIAVLTVGDYASTDWTVVEDAPLRALEENEAYMLWNEDKERWVSTTNPAKHIAAGKRVAIFSAI